MHLGAHAELNVSYDWPTVVLSVFVACLSAYTALDLTGPAAHARTPRRALMWTVSGTAALAIGVWSMHFIGMQAFRIAIPLRYDVVTVAASFILAFAGAMVSLWWLVRGAPHPRAIVAPSVLLGVCLAGMHYTGMAALVVPAVIRYNALWVAVSVLIAIGTSYAAFRLAGTFVQRDDLRRFVPKICTAFMLGVAIVSVHYTGMAAAHFYSRAVSVHRSASVFDVDQATVAIVVAVATVAILGLFLFSSWSNRRAREREREEARFRMLAASAPNMIWTLSVSGEAEYVNPRFIEYTGLDCAALPSADVREIVHPDDFNLTDAQWTRALVQNESFREEVRLRAKDGSYRWHVMQIMPVHAPDGRTTGYVGSCTDIHEQKQAHLISKFLDEATHSLNAPPGLYSALTTIGTNLCRYVDWCDIQFQNALGNTQSVTCGDLSPALGGHVWQRQLTWDERLMGSLTVVRKVSAGNFTGAEVTLFDHLAMRIAAAVANANLYEREHRVAQSFQQASLPAVLPHAPGVQFDAVYIPGRDEATVGGDWYDAVRLLDGRVVISIGDVAGSGLEAAVTMGNVRQIIRGIAQVHADPGLMLDAADRALRIEDTDRFVTAFVGVLDPVARTLTYASAGHPPPMLRYADGRVEALGDGGLPLGLRLGNSSSQGHTVQLQTGCALVLYTDGLTEMQRTPIDGEARLRHVLSLTDPLHAPSPAQWIRHAILDKTGPKDDVAILVITLTDDERYSNDVRRWKIDVRDASAAHALRLDFANDMRERGVAAHDVALAEIVMGELLGNTVRYAPGMVEVIADWSTASPVLHVLDGGPGFQHIAMLPEDLYSESGRGLFIVSSLTNDFRVSRRQGGGSHARAVLRLTHHHLTRGSSGSLVKALVS